MKKIPEDAEGESRARSAAEKFLFQRLETLPQTKGLFKLNAILPISFSGNGTMEVDLLCAAKRLVVEIDGIQHLSDKESYRRDRRKDFLLQEQGYHVIRFLSEDVSARLNDVLDTILRVLQMVDN